MGRGGFPPSETGSFSAHHTATWVGFSSAALAISFWLFSPEQNQFFTNRAIMGLRFASFLARVREDLYLPVVCSKVEASS
jgi:hypothetical protein